MMDSFFVIDPDVGRLYMLLFSFDETALFECTYLELHLRPFSLDKLQFYEMLNPQSQEYGAYIADRNLYFKATLILMIVAIFAWRTAHLALSLLLEAFVAALIVWSITSLMNRCGAFTAMNPRWRSPTLMEVWSLQRMLCVPDISFLRLFGFSALDSLLRIPLRIALALCLLIDVYQNDPLQL